MDTKTLPTPPHPIETHSSPADDHPGRHATIACPSCQSAIELTRGLCGQRQIDAILLQSARIGVELECGRCGLRFVIHRPDPLHVPSPPPRQSAFDGP